MDLYMCPLSLGNNIYRSAMQPYGNEMSPIAFSSFCSNSAVSGSCWSSSIASGPQAITCSVNR